MLMLHCHELFEQGFAGVFENKAAHAEQRFRLHCRFAQALAQYELFPVKHDRRKAAPNAHGVEIIGRAGPCFAEARAFFTAGKEPRNVNIALYELLSGHLDLQFYDFVFHAFISRSKGIRRRPRFLCRAPSAFHAPRRQDPDRALCGIRGSPALRPYARASE